MTVSVFQALGPVSMTSRNLAGQFRVSQFPLYVKNGFKSSNVTVINLFVTLKTCLTISFPKQAVGSFTNGFSGPKSYRDFRETVPCSRNVNRPQAARNLSTSCSLSLELINTRSHREVLAPKQMSNNENEKF